MKLFLPALLLVAAETASAFAPAQNPVSLATYAPLFSSKKDTIETSIKDAVETGIDTIEASTPTKTTDTASNAEKEIDWDALLSAASAFGGAIVKGVNAGVKAAAPVVADAAVDAAFDIKGAATDAIADLQKLNEQAAKNGGLKVPEVSLPKVSLGSFGWKSAADVSVPYDAACRLAYEEWKAKFGKTEPREDDPLSAEERFQQFRISYERVTIANVAAKKKVRDAGGFEEARTLKTVELDQYADLTDLEYTEATRTPSWGEIFGDLADAATSVVSKSVPTSVKMPAPPKAKPTKTTAASKKPTASNMTIKAASSIKKPSTTKPSLSIFGAGNGKAPAKRKMAPAKKSQPTMTPFFGAMKATTPAAKSRPTTTPFFGAMKATTPAAKCPPAKPFFGAMKVTTPAATIKAKASPVQKKTMTAKEKEFAKKIEASRAAKAKALAERKKKQEAQLRKARTNFRG